jgi:hypothetical protein|tara:strand:- start:1224 stop:1397 length:174 start_codon:yes stop_codon:yes gene_type:complete
MRTQNKENYYYVFWVIAMIAFIIPQVFTAYAVQGVLQRLNSPIQIQIDATTNPNTSI